MKKVIGIILTMVFVLAFTTAFALCDYMSEIISYCEQDTYHFGQYIEGSEHYNVIGDHAYAIAEFSECDATDIREFEKWYKAYLADFCPEIINDVKVDFTYAGHTENYRLYCIWLELDNGKTFGDYVEGEPFVKVMSGMIGLGNGN